MPRVWTWLSGFGIGFLVCSWLFQTADAGPLLGENPAYSRDQGRTSLYFYVASGNGVGKIEYICTADPSTASSAANWQITRFTYDSSNRVSEAEWAAGSDAFSQICDNRVSLTYN